MSSSIMSARGGVHYTFSNWSHNVASEANTSATFLELVLGFLLVSGDWEGGGAVSPSQTHPIIHTKMQRKLCSHQQRSLTAERPVCVRWKEPVPSSSARAFCVVSALCGRLKRHLLQQFVPFPSLPFPFRSTPPHDISLTLLKQPNQVAKHSPFTSLGVWTCNTTAKVRQLLGFSTDVLFSSFLQMYRSVCIWGSVTLQLSAAMNLLLTWSMVLLVQASWSHQWIFIWEFFLCAEKNYLPGDSCIFLFQCVPFYLLILWARAV